MTDPVVSFTGPYRFLSNFYPAAVTLDGFLYPTVEHAYQAAKTLDIQGRSVIRRAIGAHNAKRQGSWVRRRPGWEQIKLSIMEDLVRQKFTTSESLMNRLIQTGDAALIEVNMWGDRFWGIYNGEGENHLGIILMKVRAEIQSR